MSEEVLVPSDRDVRGTLDSPDAEACVVACPPHPQMGGSRSDRLLRAVSDAVDCACLRFDYGAWSEGCGELTDARDSLAWARDRYGTVALFGYSFGGCLALVAAAESETGRSPSAAAALSPADRLSSDIDAVAAIENVDCPVAVVYGCRDTTVDAEAVAKPVEAAGGVVEILDADHFFVGQAEKAAERVGRFLCR